MSFLVNRNPLWVIVSYWVNPNKGKCMDAWDGSHTNTGKFLGTRKILEALKVLLMFLMPILPSFERRACGSDSGSW